MGRREAQPHAGRARCARGDGARVFRADHRHRDPGRAGSRGDRRPAPGAYLSRRALGRPAVLAAPRAALGRLSHADQRGSTSAARPHTRVAAFRASPATTRRARFAGTGSAFRVRWRPRLYPCASSPTIAARLDERVTGTGVVARRCRTPGADRSGRLPSPGCALRFQRRHRQSPDDARPRLPRPLLSRTLRACCGRKSRRATCWSWTSAARSWRAAAWSRTPLFIFICSVHRLVPEARCVLHTHMPYATALGMLEDARLEMAGQSAIGFHDDIAYVDYNGLALDYERGRAPGARPRRQADRHAAQSRRAGDGASAAQAFERLYFLERACQAQILALSTGRKLRIAAAAGRAGDRRAVQSLRRVSAVRAHRAALRSTEAAAGSQRSGLCALTAAADSALS